MTHLTPAQSYAYCERVARTQAANFYPAFRVLPRPQRRAMCALYASCGSPTTWSTTAATSR
jgi:phytoene/squalene synthetase